MKTDSIQRLLERYREGTLSGSELDELNRLTHRDEVMAGAERRAAGIVRRRRAVVFTVAGLLLAGTAVWTLLPMQRQQAPLVAEATVPEVIDEPTVEHLAPAVPVEPAPSPAKTVRHHAAIRPATVATPLETESEEPVVVCNNQCEADSVISDIWKFLTV